jgi:hypothetical protein
MRVRIRSRSVKLLSVGQLWRKFRLTDRQL